MTNRKLHALSIDTKIDDFGWPWTAMSSTLLEILRDFADVEDNIGYTNEDRPVLSATEL